MKLKKGKAILLLGVLETAAWVFAGQIWYKVSMTPNDETVVLKEFDGLAVHGYISPILFVTLAAIAVGLLTSGKARAGIFWTAAAAATSLTAMSAMDLANQNLSGVASQIELATGIAATHGLTGVEIVAQVASSVSLVSFGLLALGFALSAISSIGWQKREPQIIGNVAAKKPKDAISLWDEQR